jgi:hypothetical protein
MPLAIEKKKWNASIARTMLAPINHKLTKLTVEKIAEGPNPESRRLRVRIPTWSHGTHAWIDSDRIPDEIWAKIEQGTELLALVNIEAASVSSLNFVGFHLAADFFPTLVRVHGELEQNRFHVVVPAWDPYLLVPVPTMKVPQHLRRRLRHGYEFESLANLLETDPDRFVLLEFSELRDHESPTPPPEEIRLYRTILDVVSVEEESGQICADVDVSGFEAEGTVRIPEAIVPWYLRPRLRPGTLLFAKVNLGETDPSQLRFFEFELAPQPRKDHVAARSALFPDP